MDPNAVLAELLDAARTYRHHNVGDSDWLADRMATGIEHLHTWITGGGFLPAAWTATAGATPALGTDTNGEPS